MQVIEKQVAELVPYENNPRHNEDAVKFVASSIQQFGFKVPIVISPDNVIIAGHTRVLAAKELGMATVPCVIADDLTEEQMKAFRLADNKVAEASGWDWDKLEQELFEIQSSTESIDMSDFGFEITAEEDNLDKFFEDTGSVKSTEEKTKTVTCPHCGMTFEI